MKRKLFFILMFSILTSGMLRSQGINMYLQGLLHFPDPGFISNIEEALSNQGMDPEYHRYEEVLELLAKYHNDYPEITFLDTIGQGQRLELFIPAIKISDNASMDEDEPAVLFDGLHHATEPVGMESVLFLLDYLLSNYGTDPQVTEWIDNTEIWIVPMINPEGWKYLAENYPTLSYWRKNIRENGNNTVINADFDGVDVNRNYDFNWITGGSGDPGSNTYRGPEPFSESEARAKRDLALDQKFVISLSYHSYGEVVIYSWSEEPRAPDQELIYEIADSIASRIPKINGNGTYSPRLGSCMTGFSRCWAYAVAGSFEFTVETASEFLPPGQEGLAIAEDNLPGALYVLDRVRGPGITGHIKDKLSGEPLSANYRIKEIYEAVLVERTSDRLFGRYDRLLQPGEYTLEVSKEGYLTETIQGIRVEDGGMTQVEVELTPVVSGIEDIKAYPYNNGVGLSQNYPNPFSNYTTIKYYTEKDDNIRIEVVDLLGKKVTTISDEWHSSGEYSITWNGSSAYGQKVPPGFYIYRLVSSRGVLTRNLIIK